MKNGSFVHLHVHSTFSLLDGMCKINKLVSRAKELGYNFLGISDHSGIDGVIKFQKESINNEITPIIGCEAYLTKDMSVKEKGVKSYHCLLIVKNEIGWKNLLKMLTIANLQGFYHRPRIDYETLYKHNEGLIISTACSKSFLLEDEGKECFLQIAKDRNYKDVYLEIMPHSFEEQIYINNLCYDLHSQFEIPLIATNDTHYINKEDSESHEVLLAIQTKTTMNNPNRWKFNSNEYYFKTADQMIESFELQKQFDKSVYIEAIKNTVLLAESCNFRIPKHKMSLPQVPGLEKVDEDKYLRQLVIEGYYERVGSIIDPIYELRLENELDIISKKGFTKYFLIVWDFVNWMRKNNFFMSPGRGSVGSSLVAYLIGITNVDSIKYNLPFSRFINEERIDWPDIDLDIPDNRREEAINYLKYTYGENNIANIGTFLTLKSRGIVRDVARVFEIPLKEVDEFSKTINEDIKTALQDLIGVEFEKKYPEVIKHALTLEGIEKSTGRHAAGIVLSKDDLRESGKCYLKLQDGNPTVNWDLGDAEMQGLLKLDALGLNALSILAETNRLIKLNNGKEINFQSLTLDDPKVFKELSNGNTTGVFQFGTKPMTDLVKRMGVSNFEEMYAAVALVRPGAADSGITDEFIERKHGKKWEKKHPIYEEVTKNTYSLVVFQEQVMNVAHKVAGMKYSDADSLRKIIGKKRDAKEFEKFKDMFIHGCLKQKTFSKEEAEKFWEDLQYSANYIFNLAHSVEYSMLGYWTMYSKIYYPSEFIAASLTMGSDTHKPELVKESRRLGLTIVPPKIGLSDPFKWICVGDKLHIPFNEVKGFGQKTLDKLQLPKYENGFYINTEHKVEIKGKPKKILEEIKAFDKDAELPLEAYKYFDFDLSEGGYDKLLKLLNVKKEEIDIDKALRGELTGLNLLKKKPLPEEILWEDLENCKECELREECTKPIYPSLSKYPMMIVGEAGWKDEDKQGRGFVGKSGKKLFDELSKYELPRWCFHISNVVKCSPLKSKTPKETHILACSKWLDMEIKQIRPFIILALGNTNVLRFKNQKGGIARLNGTTEWNDKYGCWIHWAVHPSAALRNEENNNLFKESIRIFSKRIEDLGGV